MTEPTLGALPIDLAKLLDTRALIQANSGGGKSWCLRRMLEQTAGQVQQIVLDPEGEFATLRERFDYIVCAPSGADAVATPNTAAALARALWKAGTSAVIDIYELKAHERTAFVRRFLESLVNAPRALWHPTLVVLDEVHMFAPQAGQCESTSAVIDLATRGRKRGLSLVGATQRLSKLHKDVAAELLNKLIGRTGLDVDVQRAADELGMTRAAATEALRNLEPGEFFAFGPALSRTVERTRIGEVATTHPQTGHRALTAPPPPSKAVLAQLAKLEGVQREVEAEAQTVDDLRAELTKVRRQLTTAEKAQTGVPAAEVQRRIDEAVQAWAAAAPTQPTVSKAMLAGVEKIAAGLQAVQAELAGVNPSIVPRARTVVAAPAPRQRSASSAPSPAPGPVAAGFSGAEQRVLDGVAWWRAAGVDSPTRHQVAFVAGYTVNGHFNNVCGTLRGRGLLDYPGGGALSLTEAGASAANAPTAKPTRDDLVQRITAVLKGEPQRRLFGVLVDAGQPLQRDELARRCGYTVNGHFNNLCGALNGLGVVEYPSKGSVGLSAIVRGVA